MAVGIAVVKIVKFWIYWEAEANSISWEIGHETEEKEVSQGWPQVFWPEQRKWCLYPFWDMEGSVWEGSKEKWQGKKEQSLNFWCTEFDISNI